MRRQPALGPPVATACALLAVSFYALQRWLERGELSDIGVYRGYAALVHAGQVPYRDFAVEYPPAALPAFVLPDHLPWSYPTSFAVMMGLCGAGCILAAAGALRAVGADERRSWAALLTIGVSPIVLGSLFDTRFDLWPVLLALTSLVFVLREEPVPAGAFAGLAFAAKLWPLALAPIGLVHLARRRGPRAAAVGAAAFVLAAGSCFLPFAAVAPGGLRHSLTVQLDRPLQVESLGAAILLALERAGGPAVTTVTSHGSQGLAGALPDTVAAVSTGLEICAVLGIAFVFARVRRPRAETVLIASAATVAAVVAFGKVFSPQFLIWLVPFVPLVRGRRGTAATLLLLLALGLTRAWFPTWYWQLALDHASPYTWFLLARDGAVVVLAAVLAWPRWETAAAGSAERARLGALRTLGAGRE